MHHDSNPSIVGAESIYSSGNICQSPIQPHRAEIDISFDVDFHRDLQHIEAAYVHTYNAGPVNRRSTVLISSMERHVTVWFGMNTTRNEDKDVDEDDDDDEDEDDDDEDEP